VRLRRIGLFCLAALLATGCGHSSKTGHPGAQPKAGSPIFCTKLAESGAVRDLQTELTSAAERPATGAKQLTTAAGELTQVGSTAPTALRATFTAAAAALRLLARDGAQSASAMRKVNVALTQLGQEVQKPCGFPVS
jgi:hypothetical protein